jgi:hypothetical protein
VAWQIDEIIWERDDGASGWTTDPLVIDANSFWTFRGAFKIVDVPVSGDPIDAASYFRPQRNVNGGGWELWGHEARNVQPGYTIGLAETAPTYIEWSLPLVDPGSHLSRMEINWTTGVSTSAEIAITVNALAATQEIAAPAAGIAATESSSGTPDATESSFTPGAIAESPAPVAGIAATESTAVTGTVTEATAGAIAATEEMAGAIVATESSFTAGAIAESPAPVAGIAATEATAVTGTVTEATSPGIDNITEM